MNQASSRSARATTSSGAVSRAKRRGKWLSCLPRIVDGRPILQVDRVVKQFKTRTGSLTALEPTSFSMEVRELVNIVGPSGCGKSTLLHIAGGLTEPTSGRIYLDGHEVMEPGADRGMVFQAYTLFPWLTVRQNVQVGPELKGLKPEELTNHFLDAFGALHPRHR